METTTITKTDPWNGKATPEIGSSKKYQQALDWWFDHPIQDLYDGRGWANYLMKYYPNKSECYTFTEEEVYHIYEMEMKILRDLR